MDDAQDRSRWIALLILCLGTLMIVLDTTIVNVALPTINRSLGFNQSSLAWVVNGYLLTFGGFLLLGGRLGDIFGARRLFMGGIALFTAASLACGLSESQTMLVVARLIQGFGGAIVNAVSLALTMALFTEQCGRRGARRGGAARVPAPRASAARSGRLRTRRSAPQTHIYDVPLSHSARVRAGQGLPSPRSARRVRRPAAGRHCHACRPSAHPADNGRGRAWLRLRR